MLIWAGICFPFSRCSFGNHVSTSPLMCGSRDKRLVINSSYHTHIPFIIGPLSYCTTYLFWLATSYNYAPFTVLVWSYHWQSRYPFASIPLWEWMYNSPWHTSGYYCSYRFGEHNTCLRGGLPPFPSPHSTMNGYSYY
jgi:hypothetical protein